MSHFDFVGFRVVVVGDLMLDKYLDGRVARISPEAPVPVLLQHSERALLGGAGNVVANLACLGARVEVVAAVGDDEAGDLVMALLTRLDHVGVGHVLRDPARTTTSKMRVMSGIHQMVRIDRESTHPLSRSAEDVLVASLERAVGKADVVVVSDYAKGLCTDRVLRAAIEGARRCGIPCVVDPKRQAFGIYAGASIIKPNRRELTAATQHPCDTVEDAATAAAIAIGQTKAAILLTRSEHGMSFFQAGHEPLDLPTAARAVFDVSGAGDTVLAVLALGTAAKLPIRETIRLANVAAGVAVSKIGTATISIAELNSVLDADAHDASLGKGACASAADAAAQRVGWGRRGLKVGFTNGCFDLMHPGHIALLRFAAGACDRLIVAINSDASVKRLKGPRRPVQDDAARAAVLGAIGVVDLVVVFDEDTPAELIDLLRPDLLVKGADYTLQQVVGAATVEAAGGRVLLAPLIPGQSTTGLLKRTDG